MSKKRVNSCYLHFVRRVTERIGGQIDPKELWDGLIWAVTHERWDLVRFVTRLNRSGRRLFKFRVPDGRVFFVIYDHELDCPITVLTPDGWTYCHAGRGRETINLEAYV